jgi:hypothetical protein
MNYHVDFCETGQGTAAAARSNVTPSRMETCLDQYRANKANNANGGLKGFSEAAVTTANASSV